MELIQDENLKLLVKQRFDKMGIETKTCRACPEDIIFLKTKRGTYMPVTLALKPHFADCPGAKQFRKRDEAKERTK